MSLEEVSIYEGIYICLVVCEGSSFVCVYMCVCVCVEYMTDPRRSGVEERWKSEEKIGVVLCMNGGGGGFRSGGAFTYAIQRANHIARTISQRYNLRPEGRHCAVSNISPNGKASPYTIYAPYLTPPREIHLEFPPFQLCVS